MYFLTVGTEKSELPDTSVEKVLQSTQLIDHRHEVRKRQCNRAATKDWNIQLVIAIGLHRLIGKTSTALEERQQRIISWLFSYLLAKWEELIGEARLRAMHTS